MKPETQQNIIGAVIGLFWALIILGVFIYG